MIKLSEEAKKAYAKYVGPDGRLIIDDSLPTDLKETFQFFNEKGINILDMNIDDSSAETLNDDVEVLDDDSDDDLLSDDSTELSDDSNIVEDDSDVDLDSLNNMFS